MPKRDFNKVALHIIEIALRYGCSPVNLLLIFRIDFSKNTSGWLLLPIACCRINLEYPFLIESTFAVLF